MNAITPVSVFREEVPNFVPSESRVSDLPIFDGRVRVTQPSSRWIAKLQSRFNELTALPPNWDGYTGRPVSFECALFAANLIERLFVEGLPPPQLVPGSDGTLQFEWHRNQFDVEIDVLAPYNVVATRYDHITEKREELEPQNDFTPLSEWIADLARPRQQDKLVEVM